MYYKSANEPVFTGKLCRKYMLKAIIVKLMLVPIRDGLFPLTENLLKKINSITVLVESLDFFENPSIVNIHIEKRAVRPFE